MTLKLEKSLIFGSKVKKRTLNHLVWTIEHKKDFLKSKREFFAHLKDQECNQLKKGEGKITPQHDQSKL